MLLAISDKSLVISASLVAVIVASTLIFGSEWQVRTKCCTPSAIYFVCLCDINRLTGVVFSSTGYRH